MRKSLLAALAGSSIATIAIVTPAIAQNATNAQQAQAQASGEDDDEAIVVTGTQIRGIAPVGSNVIGVTSDTIRSTGLTDANQLLGQLPQSNFFNMFVEPGNGVIGAGTVRVPVTRPNLRNIPVGVSGSGALTLVLMDGHHIVPAGIEQSFVDVGIVPPSLLDRMEVILDGASAVYGSDAVGGVINYITRKRFDGVDVSARYGFADDYWQVDTSVTVGKTWGTGGISLSYEFAKNSNILRGDRDHQATINWINPRDPVNNQRTNVGLVNAGATGVPSSGLTAVPGIDGLTCDVPNVQNNAQTNSFHVSGAGLAARPIFCDTNEFNTYNPAARRHSAFAVFQQDINESIKFDVTAFYSDRLQMQSNGPARGVAVITPANPFYRCNPALTTPAFPANTCTGVAPAGTSYTQRVNFSYGPALGNDLNSVNTTTKTWQITPTLSVDLGKDWQVRGSFVYGESEVTTRVRQIDTTLAGQAVTGTRPGFAGVFLNPYDIVSSNSALTNSLVWTDFRRGSTTMKDARVIADGSLLHLPGGDVKLAVGAEWVKTDFSKILSDLVAPHARFAPVSASSTSKSVFGEFVVPIFGDDNGGPGMESLVLSASGRYDDYGGGTNTFNPKFAFTYKPFDWITIRGNWGKSFRAPNAADKLGATSTLIRCIAIQTGCAQAAIQNVPPGVDTDSVAPGVQLAPCYIAVAGTPCAVLSAGAVAAAAAGINPVYLTLGGTDPNLRPETSTGWSIGADISPPLIPGLTLSATYWHIHFKDIVNLPQISGSLVEFFTFLGFQGPQLSTICRTDYGPAGGPLPANQCAAGQPRNQALLDYLANAPGAGTAVYNQTLANGQDVIYITDTRIRNLGDAFVSGIDASATYRHDVGFGSVDLSINGAWLTHATLSFAPGAPLVSQIASDTSRFRLTARLGATVGPFRAQASFRHQDGFTPRPVANGGVARDPSQTHIPAFDVIDLSFIYNIEGDSLLTKDLAFSLNINNVLDAQPPLNKVAGGGTAGGFNSPIQTLGRFIQFGVSKRF